MPQPNFVLVYADDMPADMMWQAAPLTPRLLAQVLRRGSVFLNSFCVASQCSPSRASLLSGQYPHNHGLWSNNAPWPNDYAGFSGGEGTLLPKALQNAGYGTGLFGKYLNGYDLPTVPPGWNRWIGKLYRSFPRFYYDMT